MTLFIIGLGLNSEGISKEGQEMVDKCKKIYLESYTVDFPYSQGELEESIGKKVVLADREKVEGLSIVDEAARANVALLVYGSPLTATTHITIIEECRASKVKCKVIYAGSVFDGILETGLQFYKFGKVASMPAWKKSFEPTSFMKIVELNKSIDAHTLILIDIGLDFPDALKQLKIAAKEYKIELKDMIICQGVGSKYRKIFYGNIGAFERFSSIEKPYCIILPEKLHFAEKSALEAYKVL